ncbi:MAG: hypothetical protein F2889_06755 [Actinobacteria bacterium]|uniref:Unannotated protein n=1 Tax=freshwater metagenome TaxID=449393 RepID=A0A6J7QCR0_9ZZZZ|nr:hypothetical protein [Actinomycetota bacterium]
MSVQDLLLHIAASVVVVIALAICIGASAPRWPKTWLQRDVGPLRFNRFDTRSRYRKIGITKLARRLPELGAVFGGQSKSALPGVTNADLVTYLIEVRRAEWVHWLTLLVWLPLIFFDPWWLTLLFAFMVIAGNTIYIAILRHNRLRLTGILESREA